MSAATRTSAGIDDFDSLRCVVTGAASGIGRATCDLLLQRGAEVLGIDRSEFETGDERFIPYVVDVADAQAVGSFVAGVTAQHSTVDVLINCAGISPLGNIENTTEDDWDATFAVNVRGPWLMTRALLPLLRSSSHPAIVNVASGIGLRPVPGFAAYAASKAALIALTRTTVVEFGSEGIRANCVCPGPTDTPLQRWAMQEMGRGTDLDPSSYPQPRLAEPSELAEAIVLLCSPLASRIVGSTLAVDGGRTLH